MSDPRNAAHDKKITQEKKHHPAAVAVAEAPAATAAGAADASPAPEAAAGLEASLVVLGKLKEMEFHSRANLVHIAELVLTVEDELKQGGVAVPFSEVYSAQNALQTKLTSLIEAYQAECSRLQAEKA
jgi:hypothetical protein